MTMLPYFLHSHCEDYESLCLKASTHSTHNEDSIILR